VGAELTPEQRELLERHRPLLCFDRQYDYRPLAVEGAFENPGNQIVNSDGEAIAGVGANPELALSVLNAYPEGSTPDLEDSLQLAPGVSGDSRRMELDERLGSRLYGRVVEDGGRTWLQYWYWLYYNPKNLFGFGRHEGDWEMIQVGLGADGEPEVATYAQHGSGEARHFRTDTVETREVDGHVRPVVYVAPFSHASYFAAHAHPYLVGVDNPAGGGPAPWLPVEPFGEWVEWGGRWGRSDHGIPGLLRKGPRSPAHQNPKWSSPATFHSKMRRRRFRATLGRLARSLGRISYPDPPLLEPALGEGVCHVRFEAPRRGIRRARHLVVTLHDADRRVLARRTVRRADSRPAEERLVVLHLPRGGRPHSVCGSSYNRLRQRSDVAEVALEAGTTAAADPGQAAEPAGAAG